MSVPTSSSPMVHVARAAKLFMTAAPTQNVGDHPLSSKAYKSLCHYRFLFRREERTRSSSAPTIHVPILPVLKTAQARPRMRGAEEGVLLVMMGCHIVDPCTCTAVSLSTRSHPPCACMAIIRLLHGHSTMCHVSLSLSQQSVAVAWQVCE